MGYFPNGMSAYGYQEQYCLKCVNWRDNGSGSEGCPIMDLHALHGYEDCNKPESMLHFLIPKETMECSMYQAQSQDDKRDEVRK